MNRPKGLALTVVLMCLANAMLWATIKPGLAPYSLRRFFLFTVVISIGYVVIWFYWKGRNWARIGVLLVSVSSIFSLFTWNRIPTMLLMTPTHALLALRAVLGAFLLYYLNTGPVLEFFYRESKESGLKYRWGRILYGFWIIVSNIQTHLPQMGLGSPGRHAITPPTSATILMILIGVSLLAWGVRAGIVPYHPEAARS